MRGISVKRRRAMVFMVGIGLILGIAMPGQDWFESVPKSDRHGSLLGFLGPTAAGAQEADGPFEGYAQALSVLKREYSKAVIDKKRERELTYSAIQGMLSALNDPFTSFLDPEEWLSMQQSTQGSFEGIGAVLEPIGQDVRVVRPIPGSPAFKAGLKAKDVIFSVAGEDRGSGKVGKPVPTLGKSINDVVKLIKGPKGTRVQIAVLREGSAKPLVFTLTRQRIEPPVVEYWMEDNVNKIGRIVLSEFNERADTQYDKAWRELRKQGMKALIFDLRYNPGGLFDMAIRIGSRFVSDGPLVIVQEKNGQRHTIYSSGTAPKIGDMPLVVLINESSASASEIVAGAIKDHKIGKLIGEHTFGKGLVQTLFPLADGSALRLTTSKYLTPSGHDINNKNDDEHRPLFGTGGIKPDIAVEQSPEWVDQDFQDKVHDTQLKKALEVLRGEQALAARR